MNFEQLKEAFLREMVARGRERRTITGESSRLAHFIEFCQTQGLSQLSEVKWQHVADYQGRLEKYTALVRYGKLGSVRRWLAWGHHRDHLLVNPVADWQPKHPPLTLSWVPTEHQMRIVLEAEAADSDRRFLLEFLYGTGLRVQECADVDLEDLDLELQQLTVRKSKNGKPRALPLGPKLCERARHYLEQIRLDSAEKSLFVNQKGRRMKAHTISVHVAQTGRLCGFKDFTVHSIRKAFATHLIQNGAPLPAVKALLGHDSFRSTEIYTRMMPTDLAAAASVHPRARRKSTKPRQSGKIPK